MTSIYLRVAASLGTIFISGVIVSACNSAPTKPSAENTPEIVVSRIDDLSKRPDWLSESEPLRVENGTVYSLGNTTIPGDHRVEAAYRIAENNGKAAIAGAIEQKLEFIFQNAEEGTSLDATQARYIGAEASKLMTSSIRPSKRYWEKVAVTQDSGQRVTMYRVFSLVAMPEEEFKRAILDAARRAQGKGGLSQDFVKKVDDHWSQFVGNTQERTPAAEQEPKN